MQNSDGDGQSSFQAGDAEGSALELDLFLVKRMRSVIGGDGVDGAVEDASIRASRSAIERSGGFIL